MYFSPLALLVLLIFLSENSGQKTTVQDQGISEFEGLWLLVKILAVPCCLIVLGVFIWDFATGQCGHGYYH